MTVRVVLASASPARRRLLIAAGIEPVVVVSSVDEEALAARWGSPSEIALGLAIAKARDVAGRTDPGPVLVIGCDSVLEVPTVPELAGHALGKPADATEAQRRWRLMGGAEGLLHTGHAVIHRGTGREVARLATTGVAFARLSEDEITAYVASGEPLAVAGAFTIDGRGAAFVTAVHGDPSNVVGLSLPLLRTMAAELGVPWPLLWA